jgi:hypothetical protein
VQITADGPHHPLPGIQPDANLDGHAFGALDLGGILLDRRLHGEGRIARPHGMIFMGDRRAKQGHNPITHDLIDSAFIAVDRVHHALKDGVEELAGFFRSSVGQQLHGAFEIGKEHRHLLALAFQGGLGGENFLGQQNRAHFCTTRNLSATNHSMPPGRSSYVGTIQALEMLERCER